MFTQKNKTTIILGAGASKPYGYPLGAELIDNIIWSISNDWIFLACPESLDCNHRNYNLSEDHVFTVLDDIPLMDSFENVVADNNFQSYNNINLNHSIASTDCSEGRLRAINYNNNDDRVFAIKLSQIKELKELKDFLISFSPVSIDKFLSEHPNLQAAGKLMIYYSLLKCERKSIEKFNKEFNKFLHPEINEQLSAQDNWYRLLLNEITSGIGKNNSDAILQTDLDIITFNYDISLEYYLRTRLDNIPITKSLITNDFYKDNIKIHHVYGKLHSLNDFDYGFIGGDPDKEQLDDSGETLINTRLFLMSLQLSRRENGDPIKIIGERDNFKFPHETNKWGKCEFYRKNKNIYIIGFGFEENNQRLLDFNTLFSCPSGEYE